MTDSMRKAIAETQRRREIQDEYNREHGITPKTIKKEIHETMHSLETKEMSKKYLSKKKITKKDKEKLMANLEKEMKEAARVLDFERAAELRDMLMELRSEG